LLISCATCADITPTDASRSPRARALPKLGRSRSARHLVDAGEHADLAGLRPAAPRPPDAIIGAPRERRERRSAASRTGTERQRDRERAADEQRVARSAVRARTPGPGLLVRIAQRTPRSDW
jgi:hypothetical protein